MVKFYSLSFKSSPPIWVFPIIWSVVLAIIVFLAVPDTYHFPAPEFTKPKYLPDSGKPSNCSIFPSFLVSIDNSGFISLCNCSNQPFLLEYSESSTNYFPLDISSLKNSTSFTDLETSIDTTLYNESNFDGYGSGSATGLFYSQATWNPLLDSLYLFGYTHTNISTIIHFSSFSVTNHSTSYSHSFSYPNSSLEFFPVYFSNHDSLILFKTNIHDNIKTLSIGFIPSISSITGSDIPNYISQCDFVFVDSQPNHYLPFQTPGMSDISFPELRFSSAYVNSSLYYVWNSKLWFLTEVNTNSSISFQCFSPKNVPDGSKYLSTSFFGLKTDQNSLIDKSSPSVVSFGISKSPGIFHQSPKTSLRVFHENRDITTDNFGSFAFYSSYSDPEYPFPAIMSITDNIFWLYTPYSTGLIIFDPLESVASPYFLDLTLDVWNLFDFPDPLFNFTESKPKYPWDFSYSSHVATASDSGLVASISFDSTHQMFQLVIIPLLGTNAPSVIYNPGSIMDSFSFTSLSNHYHTLIREPTTHQTGLVFVIFIIFLFFTLPLLLWVLWSVYMRAPLNEYLIAKIQQCRIHHTKKLKHWSPVFFIFVISFQNMSLLFDPRVPWSSWTFPLASFFSFFSLLPNPYSLLFSPNIPNSPFYPFLRATKIVDTILLVIAMLSILLWIYSALVLLFGSSRLKLESRHSMASKASVGANISGSYIYSRRNSLSSFKSVGSTSSSQSFSSFAPSASSSVNSTLEYESTKSLRNNNFVPNPSVVHNTNILGSILGSIKVSIQSIFILCYPVEDRRRFYRELERSRATASLPNPFDSDFRSNSNSSGLTSGYGYNLPPPSPALRNGPAPSTNQPPFSLYQSYGSTFVSNTTSTLTGTNIASGNTIVSVNYLSGSPEIRPNRSARISTFFKKNCSNIRSIFPSPWPFHGWFSLLVKVSLLFFFPFILSVSRQFSCKFVSFGSVVIPLSVIPYSPSIQCLSDPLLPLYLFVFTVYVSLGLFLSSISHLFPRFIQLGQDIEPENSIPTSHALQLLLILITQLASPESIIYSSLISWILAFSSTVLALKSPTHSCWKANHIVLFCQIVWLWMATCSFGAIAVNDTGNSLSGLVLILGILMFTIGELYILFSEKDIIWKCPTVDYNDKRAVENYLVILNRIWYNSYYSFTRKIAADEAQKRIFEASREVHIVPEPGSDRLNLPVNPRSRSASISST